MPKIEVELRQTVCNARGHDMARYQAAVAACNYAKRRHAVRAQSEWELAVYARNEFELHSVAAVELFIEWMTGWK